MPRGKTGKSVKRSTKPGPSATIGNTRVLANIMRLFANTVQDGNIHFRDDGIHISGMDQSHVCLIRSQMTGDTMMYNAPESEIVIGVSFLILSKILSACSNATCTTLKPSPDNGNLEIFVMTDKGENKFVVNPMEIDTEQMDVPEMEYEVSHTLDTATLKEATDQAENLSAEVLNITRATNNEIRVRYKTDLLEGDVTIVEGGEGEERDRDNTVSIATSYLKNFLGSGPFGPKVSIGYDDCDIPMRVKCPLVGISGDISENDFVEIHIAPRVNDDDDDDLPENVREY
jgi:proliferating cell nuclear antigen PCNA